jgi:hypothetical protein
MGVDWVPGSAGGAIAGSSTGVLGTVLMILTGGRVAVGAGFACGAFFGTASAGPSTRPDQELVSAVASEAPSRLADISRAILVGMGLAGMGLWRTGLPSAG